MVPRGMGSAFEARVVRHSVLVGPIHHGGDGEAAGEWGGL